MEKDGEKKISMVMRRGKENDIDEWQREIEIEEEREEKRLEK